MSLKLRQFNQIFYVVTLSLLLSSCRPLGQARDWFFDLIIDYIPFSVDETLGQTSLKSIKKQYPVIKSPEYNREMGALLAPLTKQASKLIPGGVDLYLVDDPIINAFALPGGSIIIPTGFVQFAEHPSEILGVYAHEIAHVLKRHSTKRLIGQLGLFLAVQIVLGDASELIRIITMQGSKLLTLKNSRDAEKQADTVGLKLMSQARLAPYGLASFFQRLKKKHQLGNSGKLVDSIQGMLSTHPMSADRLSYLKKLEVKQTPGSLAHFSSSRFNKLKDLAGRLQTEPKK